MSFQIHALPAEPFRHIFALDDAALRDIGARRMTVSESPGTPCRVSLADARPGETVLLVNHQHLPELSPYRAAHAIFVRQEAPQAYPAIDEVPEMLRTRLLSLRGFDDDHLMQAADIAQGADLAAALTRLFAEPGISYIHVHFAKPGCYAAKVTRA